jgi:hypothetical protein
VLKGAIPIHPLTRPVEENGELVLINPDRTWASYSLVVGYIGYTFALEECCFQQTCVTSSLGVVTEFMVNAVGYIGYTFALEECCFRNAHPVGVGELDASRRV